MDWAAVARRDGYAHRQALIDTSLIATLRAAVLASIARHGAENVVAVQCDVMALDAVGALRNHSGLMGALAEILGGRPFPIHADVLRIVPPGAAPTPPHKDADYVARQPMWIAWLPLVDCPAELGPLVMWPSRAPRPLPCTPGDVIFFSSLTEHSTMPNTGPRLRLSIDFRYGAT